TPSTLIWLHDMVLERADGEAVEHHLDAALEACFMAVMHGQAENDGYNALVIKAGLNWRDIAMLRGYSRFLRQVPIPYSQGYMSQMLVRHSAIATMLVDLFNTRFMPDSRSLEARQVEESAIVDRIEAALEDVPSLDDDTILRRFANLIRATVRTNVFQSDAEGQARPIFAFKLDSRSIEGLPE